MGGATAFDNAKDCNDYQLRAYSKIHSHSTKIDPRLVEGFTLSQCIASDDPHLKEH
jgi:hypothetical protein